MGLDLEAVGMDCKSLHQHVEKQRWKLGTYGCGRILYS
jgi:hypothetical protein